jgi:cytochrome bd-type quinol oxidase subunit 2
VSVAATLVALAGGFLLAVLWMDLIFDVQVLRHPRAEPLPEPVLASIAAYYHRATTTAHPMGMLVSLMMTVLVAALVTQLVRGDEPRWAVVVSLLLCLPPIVLALASIFPSAIRLGRRRDDARVQSALARSICRAHLGCLGAIGSLLALQVWVAAA